MEYKLFVSDRAQEEAQSAINYYDGINPELASRFLAELSGIYHELAVNPQFYSYVSAKRKSNIRDIRLRSFPYLVIYEIRKVQ